jgi:hypothetical protein
MEPHELYSMRVLIWAGVLTLTSIVLFFAYLQWRHKKPFGEVLTVIAAEQSEQVFIFLTALAFCAEAWTAASVHAPGMILPNPLSRFILHIFIATIGFVAPLTMFREAAFVFAPKAYSIDFTTRLFKAAIFFLLFTISIGAPYANLVLLAGNIAESQKLSLFFVNNHPFVSMETYGKYLELYGLPRNYDAFSSMNPSLQASVTVTVFHVMLIFLAALQAVASPSRRKLLMINAHKSEMKFNDDIMKINKEITAINEKYKKEDKPKEDIKAPESATAGEKRATDKVQDNITTLLKHYGYEKDKLDNVSRLAFSRLYKINSTHPDTAMNITARIATATHGVNTLNNGIEDATIKERVSKEVRAQILSIFENKQDANEPGLEVKLASIKK